VPNSRDHNSHSAFTHDSIEGFGYDWERVGDPGIRPRYPLKIYLPQTTADVVRAVRETRQLGQRLLVRSKGHSSNDLVLEEGGAVLCTELMNKIQKVDEGALAVTVQAGTPLADIDDHLSRFGLGLPVIGDHNHITAGGFASVGGANAASHRFGLFVDNVRSMEYVTWEGEVAWCTKADDPAHFFRLLTGLGRHGVITTLVLDVMRVAKMTTVLENKRTLYRNVERYVADSSRWVSDPGDSLYLRGLWADKDKGPGKKPLLIGQLSRYVETSQGGLVGFRDRLSHRYLHAIGRRAGRASGVASAMLHQLGIAGLMLSPRYASIKNVEIFVDRILDSTKGEPSRWLAAFVPLEHYPAMFRRYYDLCRDFRTRYGCFTLIGLYIKSVKSSYLAKGDASRRYGEMVLHLSTRPERLTPDAWSELAGRVDEVCMEYGGFRYMHTKTGRDATVLRRIDPNAMYAEEVGLAVPAGAGALTLPGSARPVGAA